jgi:hypothetical protein
MIVYDAMKNSDQTEGRGPMRSIALYRNLEDAVARVQNEGVMGVGTGDVYEVNVLESLDEKPVRTQVYGYRKDWRGVWGYGYVDNRDAPIEDPDFQTYLRLREKFKDT